MAQVSIPWADGNGSIVLTYGGTGSGVVTVSSTTDNLGQDRSQVITLRTTDERVSVQVTVTQPTGMRRLVTSDVKVLTARGYTLRVYPSADRIPE